MNTFIFFYRLCFKYYTVLIQSYLLKFTENDRLNLSAKFVFFQKIRFHMIWLFFSENNRNATFPFDRFNQLFHKSIIEIFEFMRN